MIENAISEHIAVLGALRGLAEPIAGVGRLCSRTLQAGGKILLCGNGGSAADAQHIAAELVGRYVADRRPLAAISLTTDTSALTCISNDYSFDQVFSRQVAAIGKAGDLLLAISTSGNSKNISEAVVIAKAMEIKTIGLLGKDGGNLAAMVDLAIVVPSAKTARIQEAHIFIGHLLCEIIERELDLY